MNKEKMSAKGGKNKNIFFLLLLFVIASGFFGFANKSKATTINDCYDASTACYMAENADTLACDAAFSVCAKNASDNQSDSQKYPNNDPIIDQATPCASRLEAADGTCYSNLTDYCAAVNDPTTCGNNCDTGLEAGDGTCYSNLDTYCAAVDDTTRCTGTGGCQPDYEINASGECVPTVDVNSYAFCMDPLGGRGDAVSCKDMPGAPTCDPSPSCWVYNCCPKDNTNTYAFCMDPNGGGGNATSCKDMPGAPNSNGSITTTQPTAIINKNTGQPVSVPAGSKIDTATGAVYAADGTQLLPPGSVQNSASGSSGGGLSFVANGPLGPVYQQGQGVAIPGSGNNVYSPGGLPGTGATSTTGLAGQGGCGTGFTSVGGVCFPTTTGLSSAPITVILSNIFSWLMGLFTTFAVGAFVVSGIQYLTAAGSDDQMQIAKRNATYALIGIVVGLSGFVIVQAIAGALSGQGYFF